MGAKQRGASTLEHCASRPHEANSARRLVIIADDSLTTAALQIGFRQSLEFELVGHRPSQDICACDPSGGARCDPSR